MAGDWIKMRTSLLTNPKVNGIARELESHRDVTAVLSTGFKGVMSEIVTRNVMRHVTVSCLLVIWGAANEHTKDGVFRNADISDIDDMVGVPGFAAAMEDVGWLVADAEAGTVTLPNFNEYNTSGDTRSAGAKTNAQRQKEYRDRHKHAHDGNESNVTSDVTSNRREEKRREEKEETPPANASAPSDDNSTKGKKGPITIDVWIASLDGADAIPGDDTVFEWAEKAGIPLEFLELSWLTFLERMREGKKRQKDWRAHYRNAVRDNWYKLWWINSEGEYQLTTTGQSAKRAAA